MDKNFLGIDWGERKVGIALAHAETKVAVPYGIFTNDATLLERLQYIVAEEEIGTVVIGIPEYQGKQGIAHPAKAFGEKLSRSLGIAVTYTNEMFTTKLAQDTLRILGGKAVGEKDDAEAAKILLQGWVDGEGA